MQGSYRAPGELAHRTPASPTAWRATLTTNFTFQEILGSSIAFALFPLIFVFPGYVVSWLLDLFDFKQRLTAARFVIAIVVSVAISPILTFLTYYLGSARLAFAVLAAFAIAFGAILIGAKADATPSSIRGYQRTALIAAGCWAVVSILLLVDLQWGDKLYFNRVSYDFTTRVAIINAISRSGVPPVNASYFPGHPVLLTYVYYFWYIPASLVAQIGGSLVDAHSAMLASVVWCGLGLGSVVTLYLRLRNPEGGAQAWKRALLGASLLLVSGLDVIPILLRFGQLVPFHGDLEHWNEQIIAWAGGLLWVPHHVAALIACMVGVLLVLWMRGQPLRRQLAATFVAGLAFASAIGLSVFVTLVFAVFWAIWLAVLFFQKERRLSLLMAVVGAIGLIAASPFLMGLVSGSQASGSGGLPLAFAVRIFRPIVPFVSNYPPRLLDLIFLLVLPINYLMELGFYFVAALFWVQQHASGKWKQNPFHVAEVLLLGVTVFIGSFIRSTTIGSNDLGWRSWLAGQFVLLIWGVDVIQSHFPSGLWTASFEAPRTRRLALELQALLLIGLVTTIVDLVLLRTWPIFQDLGLEGYYNLQCPDLQQGKRTYSARQAFDYINANTPAGTIIETSPGDLLNIPLGLYANRQIAVSGHTAYGIPQQELIDRAISVVRIFREERDWPSIDASCRTNSINVIVANDLDPIWEDLPALEVQRKPLYQNAYYAVLACGDYVSFRSP